MKEYELLERRVKHQTQVLENVSNISMLLSFKLADMVNIALDENTYFKSEEWCDLNKSKMMVEHDQEDWNKQLFKRFTELQATELSIQYGENSENMKKLEKFEYDSQVQKYQPIVKFF